MRTQDELRRIYQRLMYSSVFGSYVNETGTQDAWNGILRVLSLRWQRHQRGGQIRDYREPGDRPPLDR